MENYNKKPECKLIGENGNIFNLLSIAVCTLRKHGLRDQAEELNHRIWQGEATSYHHAIQIIMEYVEVI